nr:MAG TPA: BppU domain protein [Bacteriophage sp.]
MSITNTQKIKVAIDDKPPFEYVLAKEGEITSRTIEISFIENNMDYTIPANTTARIKVFKPDGNRIIDDCQIKNNKVICTLSEQMLSAAGVGKGEILLYNGDDVLISATFYMKIVESVYKNHTLISDNDYFSLNKIMIETIQVRESLEGAAKIAETQGDRAREAADKANKAATTADTATAAANKATEAAQKVVNNVSMITAQATNAATNAASSASAAASSAKSAAASESNANTYKTNAASSASAAASSAKSAAASESNANTYKTNAASSANTAETARTAAETYKNNAQTYMNNAKSYMDTAKTAAASISGALKPKGTVTFANLPAIKSVEAGAMYNISTEFTSTTIFKDGGGIQYPAGTNVYKTEDAMWDCLGGELSDYLMIADIDTAVEEAMPDYTASTSLQELVAGESVKSAFGKIKTAVKNVIAIVKLLGSTDISKIGNGTVTGAISNNATTINNVINKQATDLRGVNTKIDEVTMTAAANKKLLGSTSISGIGNGTVTGAINTINSSIGVINLGFDDTKADSWKGLMDKKIQIIKSQNKDGVFLIRGGWSGREYGITIGQSISGDVVVYDFSAYGIYVGMKMGNETYASYRIYNPSAN